MTEPTSEQIEAFIRVFREEGMLPYGPAPVDDFLHDGQSEEERREAIRALNDADDEADRSNRDLIRRALRAALDPSDLP